MYKPPTKALSRCDQLTNRLREAMKFCVRFSPELPLRFVKTMTRFQHALLFSIALLAVWTFLYILGAGSLHDWDEATYGEIAREMVRRHDWMTPYWNESPLFDKPPLMMWLIALALSAHVPEEWAVRLPSALAGLTAVALTGWLGTRMFEWTTGATAALLLMIGSASQRTFPGLARHGMLDAPLAAAMVWVMLHLWLGIRDQRHWLLLGLPLGIGFIVKSLAMVPLVAVVVLGAVLLRLLGAAVTRRHWRALGGALLIAVLIALPWHLIEWAKYGRVFLHDYVLIHLSKGTGVQDSNTGDWWFYLAVLRQGMPRWWWFTVPALALATWNLVRKRDARALLLVVWVVIPLAFFTAVATKLPWYVLPIYPALALLTARLLHQLTPAMPVIRHMLVGALLVVVTFTNLRADWVEDRSWAVKLVGRCVQLAAAPSETIGFFLPRQPDELPSRRPLFNVQPSVRFYADRHIYTLRDPEEVARWLGDGGKLVWSDTSSALPLDGLVVPLMRVGNQQLSRRDKSTPLPDACRPSFG
jgi:4-amino-4-deoxy-L-arabinose transferase-like glycosyltransferase